MIHHIVMFKLLETPDAGKKEAHKQEIKERLERLPAKIDVIQSLDDLETYRVHPAHKEFVEYVSQIREKAASVDYEI